MAAGDTYDSDKLYRAVKLLDGLDATNAAPSAADDGVSIGDLTPRVGVAISEASLALYMTGTGTLTLTGRLWVYSDALAVWLPYGKGADDDKGKINDGDAIGETGTNTLAHTEPLLYLGHFDRLYLEATIGGTGPSLTAYLIVPRKLND